MTPFEPLETPLVERVLRDHILLRKLFNTLARACDAKELRAALWDLYLSFNAHLDMEELKIAPVLRAGPMPERALAMILEHNEQRKMLRELMEDVESEAGTYPELQARANDLVSILRDDMTREEISLQRAGGQLDVALIQRSTRSVPSGSTTAVPSAGMRR